MSIPKSHNVRVRGYEVGVYEYGDPGGAPVFVFHGTPACGAGFAWADQPARDRGLRLIAPDRPGIGASTRLPGWTVAGYAVQVAALAEVLGIDRAALWGYSGGGPYAVACAALLPIQVTSAVVCAGSGQVGVWAKNEDFEKTDRQMLRLAMTRPWLARLILGVSARVARVSPKTAVKSFASQLSERDREVIPTLGTPAEQIALFTKAFTHGAHGVVADYAALAQPWGVTIETIGVPLEIFHGDDDPMVPLRHSEELAKRAPGAHLVVWPREGHLGTITHVGEVLDALKH
jgi:pimeloyl-ACP methyl ester carboxylesterase